MQVLVGTSGYSFKEWRGHLLPGKAARECHVDISTTGTRTGGRKAKTTRRTRRMPIRFGRLRASDRRRVRRVGPDSQNVLPPET
jgi:hypothetical protein